MTHVVTSEGDLAVVRFTSNPTLEELRQIILQSDGFGAERELWDLTACSFSLTSEQMQGLAELAKSKQHHPSRTAIVADGDVAYGLSRLYAVYRRNAGNETSVFRTEDDARLWLSTK